MHSSSMTFLLSLCATHFFPVMHFIVLLCLCLRKASRNEGFEEMLLVVLHATWTSNTGFRKDCYLMGIFI